MCDFQKERDSLIDDLIVLRANLKREQDKNKKLMEELECLTKNTKEQ